MMDSSDIQSSYTRKNFSTHFDRETKLNEKQFLVSLFFNQEDLRSKSDKDSNPYQRLVEGGESLLQVPGIMDEWKEEIIR